MCCHSDSSGRPLANECNNNNNNNNNNMQQICVERV